MLAVRYIDHSCCLCTDEYGVNNNNNNNNIVKDETHNFVDSHNIKSELYSNEDVSSQPALCNW